MQIEKLEQIVHLKPFKPYRLLLASGEEIIVDRPFKSHVSGDAVSLMGRSKLPGAALPMEKFRIVPANEIELAEHVELPVRNK